MIAVTDLRNDKETGIFLKGDNKVYSISLHTSQKESTVTAFDYVGRYGFDSNLDKIYFRWEMIKYFYSVYNVSYSVLLLGRNKIGIEANRLLKHASTTQFLYSAVSLIS